jgi:hypothetical protein
MSRILGPDGQPVVQEIPQEVIMHYLANHEARLNALAAQSINLGLLTEWLFEQLTKTIPGFELDIEEFSAYRESRLQKMKEESDRQDSVIDLEETN